MLGSLTSVVNYLLKRVLLMVPTLAGIVVVSFLVMKLAPGDPSSQKFGGAQSAVAGMNSERGTQAAEQLFRKRFLLDEPLHVQFWAFLNRLATGDLVMFQTNERILAWDNDEFWVALRTTAMLNLVVFILIYLIAIPTGIYSAAYPNSTLDRVITAGLFLLYSLPSFWVAEILRMTFVGYLPILGLRSNDSQNFTLFQQFTDYLWHIILPVTCLTYGGLAYLSRQMRAGMLEVIRQDYIRTAQAKGCSKLRVILVHALRNGLFPIITLLASLLPFLVSGSVIIETVFNIPGLGWKSYEAVNRREYDFVMLTLMLSAVLTLVGILISDVLYVIVNPRVSFDSQR